MAGLLGPAFRADAQQAVKRPRISVIYTEGPSARDAFRQGLQERGWIEGQNIVVDYRLEDGRAERLTALTAELVNSKIDVIVASSNPVISALKRATDTVPIVMSVVGDPVGAGFVASLARPGGNITGLSNLAEGLSAKRLEILREIKPGITRVAVLRNSSIATHVALYRETEIAAHAMKVMLVPIDFRAATELEEAFKTMVRERADAFIPLPDPITVAGRATVVGLAAKHALAGMYPFAFFVEAGGLSAYGSSVTDLWRRAAGYVDRILQGAKPAELPIEQPTKFELVLNQKTAKTLGIAFPQSLLLRADKVIE
jgi:putative ABC transport system substrate-binding protein